MRRSWPRCSLGSADSPTSFLTSLTGLRWQRVSQLICTRMGDAIVLDLTVRDGPSRDDGQLTRKADLFKEEFGMDVRVTIAKDDALHAASSGGMVATRHLRHARSERS